MVYVLDDLRAQDGARQLLVRYHQARCCLCSFSKPPIISYQPDLAGILGLADVGNLLEYGAVIVSQCIEFTLVHRDHPRSGAERAGYRIEFCE